MYDDLRKASEVFTLVQSSEIIYNYFMVSVFEWPDPNTRWNVARVKKSARKTRQRRVILHTFLNSSNIPKLHGNHPNTETIK